MISKSIDLQVKREIQRLIYLGVIYKIVTPKYKLVKGIFKKSWDTNTYSCKNW